MINSVDKANLFCVWPCSLFCFLIQSYGKDLELISTCLKTGCLLMHSEILHITSQLLIFTKCIFKSEIKMILQNL